MEEDSDDEEPRPTFEYAPSKLVGPSKPAAPSRPTGLCSQDWRFQVKSATRGLANLSMG